MSGSNCAKHPFEIAENVCASCHRAYCAECLVYSFGAKKPPFCIPCAVSAAGIRTTAAVRPLVRTTVVAAAEPKPKRSLFRRPARATVPAAPVPAPAPVTAAVASFDPGLLEAPSPRPVEESRPVWNGEFDWEPAPLTAVD
jgi:hypothetical protein